MSKKHFIALIVLAVSITLLPSEAWAAGPEMTVLRTAKSIWSQVIKPLVHPFKDMGNMGIFLSAICSSLSVIGFLWFHQKLRDVCGRFGGFLQLPIIFLGGFAFISIAIWGVGWATSFLLAKVGIPGLLISLIKPVIMIILIVGAFITLATGAAGYVKALIQIMKSQIIEPLKGNYNQFHEILGAILFTGLLNLHWAGSVCGALFGVTALIRRSTGAKTFLKNQADKQLSKLGPAKLHSDKSWDCPNCQEKTVRVNGKSVKKIVHCERRHKPNAANAKFCGSRTCDYPNPHLPTPCKRDGCDNKEVSHGTSCTECGFWKDPLPKTMPWTTPETDKFNEDTHGEAASAREATTPQGEATTKEARSDGRPDWYDDPLELDMGTKPCPSCKHEVELSLKGPYCDQCGATLSDSEEAVENDFYHLFMKGVTDDDGYLH